MIEVGCGIGTMGEPPADRGGRRGPRHRTQPALRGSGAATRCGGNRSLACARVSSKSATRRVGGAAFRHRGLRERARAHRRRRARRWRTFTRVVAAGRARADLGAGRSGRVWPAGCRAGAPPPLHQGVAVAGVRGREAGHRVAALHQPDRALWAGCATHTWAGPRAQPAADQAVRNAGRPLGASRRTADPAPARAVAGCRRPPHALDGRAPDDGAGHDAGPPARILERDRRGGGHGRRLRRVPNAGEHRRTVPNPDHAGRVGGRRRHLALRRAVGRRALGRACRTPAAGMCICARPGDGSRRSSSAGRS